MTSTNDLPMVQYRTGKSDNYGIEVVDLERFRARLNRYNFSPYLPHQVSYFCFIYIETGQGSHQINGVDYPYQDGSVIFINQGQAHAFDANDQPQGKLVNITPNFFSEVAANFRNSYFVPFHLSLAHQPVVQLPELLNQSCQTLLHESSVAITHAKDDPVVVQLLFSALLTKLAAHRREHSLNINDTQRHRFNGFLNLVEQQFSHNREAKDYANQLHMSFKALNQLCKHCCGQTSKQLIDFRLNLEITRKLSMSGGTIQSIAFELGFDDTTNFVRYFKRHHGVTPTVYRENYQQLALSNIDSNQ